MHKCFLILVTLLTLPLFSIFAQSMQDVVYLKNGDHYKGIIIENVPNDYIRIEVQGGYVFTVHYADIEKFTKEKTSAIDEPVEKQPLKKEPNKYVSRTYKSFFITPYIKVGNLIASPNAGDLGYDGFDGALNMTSSNFGGGVQILFGLNSGLRFGADIGYQTLFSSTYNVDVSYAYYNNYEYFKDTEKDYYILGLAEINFFLGSIPLFVQPGIGLHWVSWESTRYDSDIYNGSSESPNSGSGTDFGLTAIIGTKINLSSLQIPIFLRMDQIFRYGSTINGSIGVGLTF